MLIAVLLSLLPSAVPADVCQNPGPGSEPFMQWDGETEDAYRRALHLWAVRGKPGEAADILLSLADKAEVTQIAGQASWVLVLAAQALAEAGRADEATALIPGIERGARGTPLEAAVRQKLTELRTTAGFASQGLDEAFLETLIRQLSTPVPAEGAGQLDAALFNAVRKYDRPVLPYLLKIVSTWPESNVVTIAAIRAIKFGLSMADPTFVDELTAILEAQSTLSFITLINTSSYQSVDALADREEARFWKRMSLHPDSRRRLLAREGLRNRAFDASSPAALQAIRDLLSDADPTDDAALLKVHSQIESTEDPRSKLLVDVAQGSDSEAAELARNSILYYPYLGQLRELALRGGKRNAVRYLACLAATSMSGYMASNDIGGPPAVNTILQQEGIRRGVNWKGDEEKYRDLALIQPRSFDFAKPHLADAKMRTLLAIAAAGLKDETGFELAYASGIPDDEASICHVLSKQNFQPAAFRNRAASFIGHPELGQSAWKLISTWAPEQINFDLMKASSPSVKRQFLDDAAGSLIKQGRSDEALQLARTEGVEEDRLAGLISRFVREGDQWWTSIGEIQAIIAPWQPGARKSVLQDLCNAVQGLPTSAVVELDMEQVVRVFTEARQAGVRFRTVELIGTHWEHLGRPLMMRLGTSDGIVQLMVAGLPIPAAPDFVVHCLREGASLANFPQIESNPSRWIEAGAPQLIEAAGILLARKDPAATRTALNMMFLAQDLAPALWNEVEFAWTDPELASLTATVLQQTSRRDEYVQHLMEAWRLPGLQKRLLMAEAMSATADPRMAPILLEAIADPDAHVANAARFGLQRLKEIEEQRAFWESWQATGVGGSPTAALLKQIQSKNKEVRLSAIRALGAIKAPEALPLLISLLEDPDPEVVAAARAGLTWLNPESAPK